MIISGESAETAAQPEGMCPATMARVDLPSIARVSTLAAPSPPPPPLTQPHPEPASPQPAPGVAPREAASGCFSRELWRPTEPWMGESGPEYKRIAQNSPHSPLRATFRRPLAPGSAPSGHTCHSQPHRPRAAPGPIRRSRGSRPTPSEPSRARATEPAFSRHLRGAMWALGSRWEGPSISKTLAWCRSRSTATLASMGAPKTAGHSATARLDVMMVARRS